MVSLNGVNRELRQRVEGVLRDVPGCRVTSAYRDPKEQERLYKLFLAGKGNPANRPGTSLHEKGLAVDVGCEPRDMTARARAFARWGLKTPYLPREPWHVELDPNRAPVPTAPARPAPKPPPKEVPKMGPEYKRIDCPTGGYWLLKLNDGGVGCFDGAPYFGSVPEVDHDGIESPAVDLCPYRRTSDNALVGYWICLLNGQVYAFPIGGATPHRGNYQDSWGPRPVQALTQAGEGYTFWARESGDPDYTLDRYTP